MLHDPTKHSVDGFGYQRDCRSAGDVGGGRQACAFWQGNEQHPAHRQALHQRMSMADGAAMLELCRPRWREGVSTAERLVRAGVC